MSLQNDILTILEQYRGKAISGQTIGEKLGVSRAAVWKGVKNLEKEGYKITAVPNKGYSLSLENDIISAPGIAAYLQREEKTRGIRVEKSLLSTNTTAKEMALQGAASGTIIAAREQKAGRGRYGKSFFSPLDKGIYMSLILRPQTKFWEAHLFTIAAAVAACQCLEKYTPEKPSIKWLNDIFCGQKKAGGILTEAIGECESGALEALIIGWGLNLTSAAEDFPSDLQKQAQSLYPQGVSKNQLIAEIAETLEHITNHYSTEELIDSYKQYSLLLGREIFLNIDNHNIKVLIKDINSLGELIIKTQQGEKRLRPGKISLESEISFADN